MGIKNKLSDKAHLYSQKPGLSYLFLMSYEKKILASSLVFYKAFIKC